MDKQKSIPVTLDVTPLMITTLGNDIRRLCDGLDKACSKGSFTTLKETQLLCSSLENYENLLNLIVQKMNQTMDKSS